MPQDRRLSQQWRELLDLIRFTEAVSLAIHGVRDRDQILRRVADEFARSDKYRASILLLCNGGSKLRVAHNSMPRPRLRRAETAVGLTLKDYRLDLDKSTVYQQVIRAGLTVRTSVREIVGELFSPPIAKQVLEIGQFGQAKTIATPLLRDGEAIGALAMSSAHLAEEFAPSVENLAGQISRAIELADANARRERAEQTLQYNGRRLRALLENSPDSVWVLDAKARVCYVSPSAEHQTGFLQRELVGASAFDAVHRDDLADSLAAFAELLQNPDVPLSQEVRVRHKDGSWHVYELRAANLLDNPAVHGIVVNARDISDRKRIEAQLVRSSKLAALGVMAGGIAHQLLNPLAVMSSCSQILLEAPDNAHVCRQCAEKIYSACQRASKAIQSLLTFASPARGPMIALDVQQVIEESVSLLEHHALARRIVLRRQLQPDLPKVQGHAALLREAFVNIMLNAHEAMPDGGALTVVTCRSESGGVKIQFQDTGCGIPPEHLICVFDPFFTTKYSGQGTGLGLAVVHSIIEQHQGTVQLHSEVNKGTTVTIHLPKAPRAA
jgi:PAS domain S-box-containing protein